MVKVISSVGMLTSSFAIPRFNAVRGQGRETEQSIVKMNGTTKSNDLLPPGVISQVVKVIDASTDELRRISLEACLPIPSASKLLTYLRYSTTPNSYSRSSKLQSCFQTGLKRAGGL